MTDAHWPDYYEVTAELPGWSTVKRAAEALGEPHHFHLIEIVALRRGTPDDGPVG